MIYTVHPYIATQVDPETGVILDWEDDAPVAVEVPDDEPEPENYARCRVLEDRCYGALATRQVSEYVWAIRSRLGEIYYDVTFVTEPQAIEEIPF